MQTLKNFYNWLTSSTLHEDVEMLKNDVYKAGYDDGTDSVWYTLERHASYIESLDEEFEALMDYLKLTTDIDSHGDLIVVPVVPVVPKTTKSKTKKVGGKK